MNDPGMRFDRKPLFNRLNYSRICDAVIYYSKEGFLSDNFVTTNIKENKWFVTFRKNQK